MSTASTRERASTSSAAVVAFRHWPLRDQPWRTAALLIAAGAVCLLAGFWTEPRWLTAIYVAAVLITAWRLWIPSRWEFGPRGITQKLGPWHRRLRWHEIGEIEFRGRAVMIYSSSDRSGLASLRGLFLRLPDEDLVQPLQNLVTQMRAGTDPPLAIGSSRLRGGVSHPSAGPPGAEPPVRP